MRSGDALEQTASPLLPYMTRFPPHKNRHIIEKLRDSDQTSSQPNRVEDKETHHIFLILHSQNNSQNNRRMADPRRPTLAACGLPRLLRLR